MEPRWTLHRLRRQLADSTPAGRHAGVGIVDLRTGGVREITTNPFGTCDTCFDGTPAWSPNGRLIAFTRSNSTGSAVFTVRPDGRDIRRLTGYELDAAHSTWSADSRRIAFNTDDDGLNPNIANDIAIVPATGGTVRNVTHNEQGVRYSFQPTWSPTVGTSPSSIPRRRLGDAPVCDAS